VLETNGQLSVVPKSQKRPVNPEDLGLETKYEGLPTPLVVDGQVDVQNLRRIGLDEQWLRSELARFGARRPGDVLYAALDTQGRLFCQLKAEAQNGAPPA